MKKLLLLVLLLAPAAHASLTSYTFTGTVDQYDPSFASSPYTSMSGSFVYNDAASVVWSYSSTSVVQGNALSNFSLRLDQDSWVAQPGMWAYQDTLTNDISLQDFNVSPVGTTAHNVLEFYWSPTHWTVALDGLKEVGGNIVTLYKDAYVAGTGDTMAGLPGAPRDSAPVPEPSSLALLGSALAAFAGWRRKR